MFVTSCLRTTISTIFPSAIQSHTFHLPSCLCRLGSSTSGSLLAALLIASNLTEPEFVALLCYEARRDAELLFAIENTDVVEHTSTTIRALQPVLPCTPWMLCRDIDGRWTPYHIVDPAPYPHTMQDDDLPALPSSSSSSHPHASHDVPSFLKALSCLASLHEHALHLALRRVGLCSPRTSCFLALALFLQELQLEHLFPQGVLLWDEPSATSWLLHSGCAYHIPSRPTWTSHAFVQRSRSGHFSPMLCASPTPCPSSAHIFPVSLCQVAFWNALPPTPFPDCFFRCLGLHRHATISAAMSALSSCSSQLTSMFLLRLEYLSIPFTYVSGFDVQMFVLLLPTMFPNGLLLVLGDGMLVHIRSNGIPLSLSPEAPHINSRPALSMCKVLQTVHFFCSLLPCLFSPCPGRPCMAKMAVKLMLMLHRHAYTLQMAIFTMVLFGRAMLMLGPPLFPPLRRFGFVASFRCLLRLFRASSKQYMVAHRHLHQQGRLLD